MFFTSDVMSLNVMMDGSMFPEGWHPCDTEMSRDYRGQAKRYSRTERPPRYYLVDFGISCRYDPANGPPLEDTIVHGGDRTVPEFQGGLDKPYDPFATDVYFIGNLLRQEFVQVCNIIIRFCAVLSQVFVSRNI